jgi:glutamine synthetase
MLNGYWANWGHDDRTVTVRVPPQRGEATRLEHRTSDGAANPYLAAAALLHAARFGVEQEMEPPAAQRPGDDPNTDVHIPDTLEDALASLAADEPLAAALGEPLVRTFTMLKRAEWDRYAAAVKDTKTVDVTPWELDYYLPFF